MRRKRIDQQIHLPEGIQYAGQETVVCVVQSGNGARNLLAARNCRHFGHGNIPFFQSCFPQCVRQHGRTRPEYEPAGFQGTIPLQSLAPIIQQRAYVQTKILDR